MATESPLTTLLREQPEERLAEWSERLAGQIAQLQFEKRLVDEAYAKRSRRSHRSAKRASGAAGGAASARTTNGGHFEGIRWTQVWDVTKRYIETNGGPVTPAIICREFAAQGIEAKTEPMRTALNRLAKRGLLVKPNAGEFDLASDGSARNGSGEGLSVPEPAQSQEPRALSDS